MSQPLPPPIPPVQQGEPNHLSASTLQRRKRQLLWSLLLATAIGATLLAAADILLDHAMIQESGKHEPDAQR